MTSPEALINELRDKAEAEAKALRLLTDAQFGPNYRSTPKEELVQWRAASELSRLSARVNELEGENRELSLIAAERLRLHVAAEQRVAAMREALEPFANYGHILLGQLSRPENIVVQLWDTKLTVDDFRKAAPFRTSQRNSR